MTKIALIKHNGGLLPADEDAAETLRKIPNGREVMADVKTPRSVRQHRLFFALLKLAVDNGIYPTTEAALSAIKVALGEADPIISAKTGEVFYALRSIKFESCDQTRFAALFDNATKVIASDWLGGVDQEALRQRVYEMLDGPTAIGRRAA